MARNLGPVCRLCRREGQKLFLKGDRCYTEKCSVDRRAYPPGQHGQARPRVSNYGAQRVDILRMILKEALFIVLVGVSAGLFMAIASGRLLASLMFENSGIDASVYIVVALMLIAIAMLACFMPAYKATKVDPSDALRHD